MPVEAPLPHAMMAALIRQLGLVGNILTIELGKFDGDNVPTLTVKYLLSPEQANALAGEVLPIVTGDAGAA